MTGQRAIVLLTWMSFWDVHPHARALTRKRQRHWFRQYLKQAFTAMTPKGAPFVGAVVANGNKVYSMDEFENVTVT